MWFYLCCKFDIVTSSAVEAMMSLIMSTLNYCRFNIFHVGEMNSSHMDANYFLVTNANERSSSVINADSGSVHIG